MAVVGGGWWRAAGLDHLLQRVKFHARDRLVLGNCNVLRERVVPHVKGERVAVLVDRPLKLVGVGMARANVLALEVL